MDLLGPYQVLPFPSARKPVKVFSLATGCQTFGAINVQILGDASTKSILIALLNLQTQFNKIKAISTDSGSQFIRRNLQPENVNGEDSSIKYLFRCIFFTAPTDAQYRNYVERLIQEIKKLICTGYEIPKHSPLPISTVFELQLLFNYVANLLNEIHLD